MNKEVGWRGEQNEIMGRVTIGDVDCEWLRVRGHKVRVGECDGGGVALVCLGGRKVVFP